MISNAVLKLPDHIQHAYINNFILDGTILFGVVCSFPGAYYSMMQLYVYLKKLIQRRGLIA